MFALVSENVCISTVGMGLYDIWASFQILLLENSNFMCSVETRQMNIYSMP